MLLASYMFLFQPLNVITIGGEELNMLNCRPVLHPREGGERQRQWSSPLHGRPDRRLCRVEADEWRAERGNTSWPGSHHRRGHWLQSGRQQRQLHGPVQSQGRPESLRKETAVNENELQREINAGRLTIEGRQRWRSRGGGGTISSRLARSLPPWLSGPGTRNCCKKSLIKIPV